MRGEDDREKGQATQSHFLKELIQGQQSRIDTQRVVPRVPQLRSFAPAAKERPPNIFLRLMLAFISAVLTGGLIASPALIVVLLTVFDGSFDCWEGEREEREMEDTDCQNHTVCACGGRSR